MNKYYNNNTMKVLFITPLRSLILTFKKKILFFRDRSPLFKKLI